MANDACLQTIPRTINTGLGALFILVALYVLGGDTLTDFALALLIGISRGYVFLGVHGHAPGRVVRGAGRPQRPAGGAPRRQHHDNRCRTR